MSKAWSFKMIFSYFKIINLRWNSRFRFSSRSFYPGQRRWYYVSNLPVGLRRWSQPFVAATRTSSCSLGWRAWDRGMNFDGKTRKFCAVFYLIYVYSWLPSLPVVASFHDLKNWRLKNWGLPVWFVKFLLARQKIKCWSSKSVKIPKPLQFSFAVEIKW